MGSNALKASLDLRSLVRLGRTEMHFEIPTFLSQARYEQLILDRRTYKVKPKRK